MSIYAEGTSGFRLRRFVYREDNNLHRTVTGKAQVFIMIYDGSYIIALS